MPERMARHEGPWRKLTPGRANSVLEVNERRPDGRSGEEVFNDLYGEGNWTFQERDSLERQLEIEALRAENKIALEGLRNVILQNMIDDHVGNPRKPEGDTYVDDEGNRLTGRVKNRVATPAIGDILISPDGDQHLADKHK